MRVILTCHAIRLQHSHINKKHWKTPQGIPFEAGCISASFNVFLCLFRKYWVHCFGTWLCKSWMRINDTNIPSCKVNLHFSQILSLTLIHGFPVLQFNHEQKLISPVCKTLSLKMGPGVIFDPCKMKCIIFLKSITTRRPCLLRPQVVSQTESIRWKKSATAEPIQTSLGYKSNPDFCG